MSLTFRRADKYFDKQCFISPCSLWPKWVTRQAGSEADERINWCLNQWVTPEGLNKFSILDVEVVAWSDMLITIDSFGFGKYSMWIMSHAVQKTLTMALLADRLSLLALIGHQRYTRQNCGWRRRNNRLNLLHLCFPVTCEETRHPSYGKLSRTHVLAHFQFRRG